MKAADRKLIQDHPLGVQFPKLAGPHLLLNWWTHDEQNHVSVARTEAQIVQIFENLVADRRHEEAKPVAYFQIDIVSPGEKLLLKVARLRRSQEIDAFTSWVTHSLKQLQPYLPTGFKRCDRFEPLEDEHDEWAAEHHYRCKRCHEGFVFDARKLYELKRDRYRQAEMTTPSGYVRLRPIPSQAPVADPSRPLFAVVDRHGHHSDGSVLEKIGPKHGGFFQEVKFFCHATKLAMPEAITSLRASTDAKWEAAKAESDKKFEAKRKKEELEHLAKLREFFK